MTLNLSCFYIFVNKDGEREKKNFEDSRWDSMIELVPVAPVVLWLTWNTTIKQKNGVRDLNLGMDFFFTF